MSLRRVADRLLLALGGLVCALLLAEVALQLGARVASRFGRQAATTWSTGKQRVLFVGDSNTYGLYLDRHEAFPEQLERLWNDSGRTPQIEVLNLGVPGMSASRLASEFPNMLRTLAPDRVFAMVGVNDYWSEPTASDADAAAAPSLGRWLRVHSRVYRLLIAMQRAWESTRIEVDRGPFAWVARYGSEELVIPFRKAESGFEDVDERLERSLEALQRQAAQHGVDLVLLGYPDQRDFYRAASQVVRHVAGSRGMRLVDLAPVFERRCGRRRCGELFFPDGHPSARGHQLIAETILERWVE